MLKNKKTIAPRKTKSGVKSKSVKSNLKNEKNKPHWMMARVDTYFAFATVFLLAGGLAMYVCIEVCTNEIDAYTNNLISGKNIQHRKKVGNAENNCAAHYYDGLAELKGWKANMDTSGEMVVQIDPSDIKKLPEVKNFDQNIMNLVDATEEVQANLEKSSEANPASITIKGYGTTCDSNLPVASLKSVAEVFKKI